MQRLGFSLYVLAIAFLAFVAGSMVVLANVFPAQPLRDGYAAGQALVAKHRMSTDRYANDHWRPARRAEQGVTVHTSGAYGGYTLYTSGDSARARLVGLDGRVVHEWYRPFSTVWQAGAAVRKPQPDELIFMNKARVLPDGSLLAIYEAAGDTPYGYGMVKLDRDSNVVWRYLEHTHHDFDLAPDGRIVVLTQDFTSEQVPGFGDLARPRLDDYVVTLSAQGEEQQKISLTQALARSRFKDLLHAIPVFSTADPLHTNAVEYITPQRADAIPNARAGDLLVSFRDLGLLAVLDPDRQEIVWASRGPWVGQHDPSLLDNGHLLLFDNLGGFAAGNGSRVLEIDPRNLSTVWQYAAPAERPFDSLLRGAAQRLPNGNTLVTESDGGRLFEVSARGELVWEFVNPIRSGPDNRYIPIVNWAQRVAADQLAPDFFATLAPAGSEPSRQLSEASP